MSKSFNQLKIAVLQTGRSVDELRAEHGDYDDMTKALLGRAPNEADTFAILDGEFPGAIDAYDALIITGSKHGVYEDHAWIPPLEALIRSAYDSGIKLVGICFGHQIIAQALGGRVEKSDRGFGCGVMSYDLIDADGIERSVQLYAWHQDQILEPPPGAEIIAQSEFCPVAALRYGDRAISFQPHPEFTAEYVSALADARRGSVISDALADKAIASLAVPVDTQIIQDLLSDFLTA